MFVQYVLVLLAATQPGLSALAIALLVCLAVFTALVTVAALVAILGGRERGYRARLVLGDLLALFERGGR